MAFEVSYNLENEQQFWDGEQRLENPHYLCCRSQQQKLTSHIELDDIVSTRCHEEEVIDNSLRSYLNVTTNYRCRAPRVPPLDQPLTAHSRVPPNRLQHCEMRVPSPRRHPLHRTQRICATPDHILSSAGNWDTFTGPRGRADLTPGRR